MALGLGEASFLNISSYSSSSWHTGRAEHQYLGHEEVTQKDTWEKNIFNIEEMAFCFRVQSYKYAHLQ